MTLNTSRPLVSVQEENCVGCNKCITVCPVTFANKAYINQSGNSVVGIDQDHCIHCGECIAICDHDARDFEDDIDRFFSDLRQGQRISIVAAPAVRFNFEKYNYKRVFGWLKSLGVNLIYDVSFGADICTWGYLKAITTKNLDSVIAQPCPAIVNYIERYQPELLAKLSPVHSPTLCTAIYLHKYDNNTDKIAFLSPCVAKADEFEDPNTGRHVNYNVTYKKLTEYIEKNNISIARYQELDFDDMGCGLGLTFSRPGGLRENVEYHVPGAFVRQMEGPRHAYHYLDTYLDRVKQKKHLPLLVDILNCAHGCNLGTATCKTEHIDDIDAKMNQLKQDCLQQIEAQKQELNADSYPLFEYFDKNLKLQDFVRSYTNKAHMVRLKEPTPQETEILFNKLHKTTDESRNINCYACGFKNCENFAKALMNNLSHPESCIYYNKVELQNESAMAEQVLAKNQALNMQNTETIHRILADIGGLTLQSDALEGSMQTISEKVVGLHKASQEIDSISATTHLLALNALVQSAHAGEAGRAFEVVSKEVKALALTTKEVVRETQTAESQIETEISTIGHISKEIRNKLTETQDHLKTIADEMGQN